MGKQVISDLCTCETDPTLMLGECQVTPYSTWTHNDNACQRSTCKTKRKQQWEDMQKAASY